MKAIRTGATPSTLDALEYCDIDDAAAYTISVASFE